MVGLKAEKRVAGLAVSLAGRWVVYSAGCWAVWKDERMVVKMAALTVDLMVDQSGARWVGLSADH